MGSHKRRYVFIHRSERSSLTGACFKFLDDRVIELKESGGCVALEVIGLGGAGKPV
jgi:hypothetical protein